jgi:hypothetical protein
MRQLHLVVMTPIISMDDALVRLVACPFGQQLRQFVLLVSEMIPGCVQPEVPEPVDYSFQQQSRQF